MKRSFIILLALFFVQAAPAQDIDPIQLLTDIKVLSADSLEGRQVGSDGVARARHYLQARMEQIGLDPVAGADDEVFGPYAHPFSVETGGGGTQGVNVLAQVNGTVEPDSFIIVTAHYDHLGLRNGDLYNGADDNASGTAAVLALSDFFHRHPPRHSIIFALLDAEEVGLQGAYALTKQPPVTLAQMVLNVNLDMIGRNDQDELYASGTAHYPFLRPTLENVAERSRINLRFGHDGTGGDDWTMASDHAAFHKAGVPFVYFGVEDHPDYHRATDVYARIDHAFFIRATLTVLDAVRSLDATLAPRQVEGRQ